MSRLLRSGAALLGLGTLVAACSSGASTTDGFTHGATPSTESPQKVAADKALATAAVLRPSDLPPGWQATPHIDDPGAPGLDKQIAGCLHVSASLLTERNPDNADSPDFQDASGGQIGNSVGYLATAAESREVLGILRGSRLPGCLTAAIRKDLAYEVKHPSRSSDTIPAGVTLGQGSTSRLSFPTIGDGSVAYRITVPIHVSGQALNIYVDLMSAIKGRAGVELIDEKPANPPDPVLEQHLMTLVVGRLSST